MRVLVTGASSLLGRHVVERLHERGDDVTAFQRRPGGLGVREVLGDVANLEQVMEAFSGAESVIHLAARVSAVGHSEQFADTNIHGTENVIRAARACGAGRLVHVSSPSVAHTGVSLSGAGAGPADPAKAIGHYSQSKAAAEILALAANSEDLSVVAIRPHLVWGPGDRQLVGRIVDRARAGRLAVVGSGCALVDTTFVDNAADALVSALDHAPEVGGRALVVSNGQPRPVREMLNEIVAAAGLDPVTRMVPFHLARTVGFVLEQVWQRLGRESDPPMTVFLAEQLSTAHWFDQRETRWALDWEPKVSLDEGFARLRAWFDRGGFEGTGSGRYRGPSQALP